MHHASRPLVDLTSPYVPPRTRSAVDIPTTNTRPIDDYIDLTGEGVTRHEWSGYADSQRVSFSYYPEIDRFTAVSMIVGAADTCTSDDDLRPVPLDLSNDNDFFFEEEEKNSGEESCTTTEEYVVEDDRIDDDIASMLWNKCCDNIVNPFFVQSK